MMGDDEYEILPHQLLGDLKAEVEALKKKLLQPDSKINELILEIESMKDSIHDLNNVFQQALQQCKDDDATKNIAEINRKLADVISQNEIIAKGMITIADKVDDFIAKNKVPAPLNMPASGMSNPMMSTSAQTQVRHDMGMPSFGGPVGRVAPQPTMDMPFQMNEPEPNFPPPPPGAPKRKGLFQ